MATNLKSQKDKPHATRLTPRPTAASAARAARNAINRNVKPPPPILRDSPSRSRATASPNRKAAVTTTPSQLPATKLEVNRQPSNKVLCPEITTDTVHQVSHLNRQPSNKVLCPENTTGTVHQVSHLNRQPSNKVLFPENTTDTVHQVSHAPETLVVHDESPNIVTPENAESVVGTTDCYQEESENFTNDNFDAKISEANIGPDTIPEKYEEIHQDETENTQQENSDDIQQTPEENVNPAPTPPPKSRPQTPKIPSRPLTPKSRSHTPSRPTTPAPPSRIPSRPTTPSMSSSRKASPDCHSRPKTPQKTLSHPNKSQIPQSAIPVATNIARTQPQNPPQVVYPPVKEEEDIKTVFATKQRQFQRMKRELDIKQQAVLEIFDNLRNLNDRLVKEGAAGSGEGFQFQELVVFNVGDWTSDEITQLCRDATASNNGNAVDFIDNLKHIDEDTFAALDSQVSSIPSKFADLCLQAFTARQELIDWIKELIEPMQDGRGESLEKIAFYNNQGLELCETLRELKTRADNAVDTVAQISRCALRERSTLLSVGESLVREIARLRQDLEARAVIVNEMREIRAENETATALQEARNQLEEERTARIATKEKLATAESQLRQTRIRVTKMDRQLREAEASIVSLTASVKALEDQSRQREVHLEARARKLKESLKTGEVAHSQIAQQRDSLQAEVQSLKEQIEALTTLNKTNLQDYNKEIKELKAALENQRQQTEKEIENNKWLEQNLAESQAMIEDLKSKIPDPNDNSPELPTEKEIDLWAELQATKEMLRMTEDEVTACKREKVRFLETLTKISESENKIGMQQKLAAELLSKEEIIGKMQIQIRELTKNIKLNEQKVAQYEQYVQDLQAHNRAAANNHESSDKLSYQDWQQEIMTLKMNLLDAVHMNEKLTEVLAQKEQQLEQQDKTSRAQARIIKVREELINMLKNKETEQSRELSALQQDLEHRMKVVDEVNKQIAAKAEEIQELFATLENKQQQIHRLEKIVLALEEQQRRAQAQRMRHEEKIAALEHELAVTNRRERKFLFF